MTEQHLRNYKIIRQLGEGGMATVYLAEHADLGHKVAIKILNKEFTYHQNIRNRFIDEAKKMVRMDHPNVVKVTDLINDPDQVAIVMEYVNGETMKDVLSKKRLNDAEIENYLRQMVAALEYVHSQGLVHRDIKPSNFIFNEKGVLKLTDFGISKSVEGEFDGHTQTSTSMSMGTPMYMSPEQVRSTKDVTHLSDIYSLGVVLWEMAAGKKPYDLSSLSVFDLQLKIVQEDLPLTNTRWDDFIMRCCQKEESKRIKNFVEISSFEKRHSQDNHSEKTIISNAKSSYSQEEHKEGKAKRKNLLFYFLIVVVITGFISSFLLFIYENEKENINELTSTSKMELNSVDDKPIDKAQKTTSTAHSEKDNSSSKSEKDLVKTTKEVKIEKPVPVILKKNTFKIGQEYQGGVIFSLDENGEHGLICMQRDLGQGKWSAANSHAEDLNYKGYDDWRLPTAWELKEIYEKRNLIGGFRDDYFLWSSQSKNHIEAFSVSFNKLNTNSPPGEFVTLGQGFPAYYRAIREF